MNHKEPSTSGSSKIESKFKPKKKTNEYINNKQFLQAIIDYKKECRRCKRKKLEKPRLTPYLGECVFKIATKASFHPRFVNYSFKDEMIGDAVENCIMYFDNFNPEVSTNPFGYFTQIVFHAFFRRCAKEEKHRYTIYKHFQETMMIPEMSGMIVSDSENPLTTQQIYENIQEFMENFEKRERDKKKKREEKLQAKKDAET